MDARSGMQLGSEGTSRCEELAEGLSAYADGAAEGVLAREIEAHLGVCAACAAELERLRALVRDLQALAEAPPPDSVWPRVRAGMARPETRAAAGPFTWVARALLALYDGDLATRWVAAGTVRDVESARHGAAAMILGLLLAAPLVIGSAGLQAWPAAVLILLLWLASLRLESNFSAGEMTALLGIGAVAGIVHDGVGLAQGMGFAAAGLSAAVATLAAAQAACHATHRPLVLGFLRVPSWTRAAAVIALAALLSRPDLAGASALVCPAIGATLGAKGGSLRRRSAA